MRNWLAVVGLLIAPVVILAQRVTTDSDPKAPFASYRTYAWTAGTPSNPLAETRIHAAVEQQLALKGLMKSDAETLSDKPQKNTQKVDKALEKIFERYPPGQN